MKEINCIITNLFLLSELKVYFTVLFAKAISSLLNQEIASVRNARKERLKKFEYINNFTFCFVTDT